MANKAILSSKFNMSLGFIPVIISIILCEFITQDIATYIGSGIGVLYCIYTLYGRRVKIPNFLLYCTTGVLLLLSVSTLFFERYYSSGTCPLILEISVVVFIAIIFLNRKRFFDYEASRTTLCGNQLYAQGAESAIVSARVLLIIASIHFLIILISILIPGPLNDTSQKILFHYCPPAVFILSILFNQFGIFHFNQVMKHTAILPIVNTKGDVIGKCFAVDAINRKNDYINPVIRIAVVHNGMLYLRPRPQRCILDKGKTDIPMECYLLFGETLKQGVERLVKHTFPKIPIQGVQFNIMYHFENEVTNRLVYLFLLEVKDENLLREKHAKTGKLWTFQQMNCDIGKNFFSSCFENEVEHLKEVIDIREKYKES